ncbi:helix-turn-helix domain-containing protein [Lactococcus formosensis subsp. bovis]|uniref:helix-turn-helix domain-containing protein n=1 Tax=Lactococcus formosensis TaxID=1281486 RepID=UPI001BD0E9AB|nr:helix-turn-helix transcriptional regulator [Lactococcus formosensis]
MTKTKLQIMREKKGLTIEQLAEKILGADKTIFIMNDVISVLYKYESGELKLRYNMANNNLEILSQALGCLVDELVEE